MVWAIFAIISRWFNKKMCRTGSDSIGLFLELDPSQLNKNDYVPVLRIVRASNRFDGPYSGQSGTFNISRGGSGLDWPRYFDTLSCPTPLPFLCSGRGKRLRQAAGRNLPQTHHGSFSTFVPICSLLINSNSSSRQVNGVSLTFTKEMALSVIVSSSSQDKQTVDSFASYLMYIRSPAIWHWWSSIPAGELS